MNMRKYGLWMLLLVLSSSAAVAAPAVTEAGRCCSGTVHGHTLGDWQQLYWQWLLSGAIPSRVGDVQFMPLPDGTPNDGTGTPENPVIYVGELSITFRPGTALMLPLSDWVGESYTRASMTPDDDPGYPPKDFIVSQSVRLTLDGRPLVDSRHQRLDRLYSEATYFPAPIDYAAPEERAPGIYADAALWVKGLGIVIEAMPVGRHVLRLDLDAHDGTGYQNTWYITVAPRRR
jgi:hypothetical protein